MREAKPEGQNRNLVSNLLGCRFKDSSKKGIIFEDALPPRMKHGGCWAHGLFDSFWVFFRMRNSCFPFQETCNLKMPRLDRACPSGMAAAEEPSAQRPQSADHSLGLVARLRGGGGGRARPVPDLRVWALPCTAWVPCQFNWTFSSTPPKSCFFPCPKNPSTVQKQLGGCWLGCESVSF